MTFQPLMSLHLSRALPVIVAASLYFGTLSTPTAHASGNHAAQVLWLSGQATVSVRPKRGLPLSRTELQPLDAVESGHRLSLSRGHGLWLYYPDLERVYMVKGPCDWVVASDRGPVLDQCEQGARLKAIDVAGMPRLGVGRVPWREAAPVEAHTERPVIVEPREASVTAVRPTLDWRDAEGGHRYEVIVWRLDAQGTLQIVERWRRLSTLSHTLSRPLTPGTDYFWAVRRSSAKESQESWSTAWFHALSPAESDEVARVGLLLAKRQVEEPGSTLPLEVLRGLVFEHFSLIEEAKSVWEGVKRDNTQYESLSRHIQRLDLRVLANPRGRLGPNLPFGVELPPSEGPPITP